MTATTPNYGFVFETPSDRPGVSLTGGPSGVESPILAEQVEDQLLVTDGNVQTLEDRIAALENQSGWRTLLGGGFLSNGEVFHIQDTGTYDMVKIYCAGNLEGGAGDVAMRINEDNTTSLYESAWMTWDPSAEAILEGASADSETWTVGKWNGNRGSYLELTILATDLFSRLPWSGISSQTSDNTSIRRVSRFSGRLNATRLLQSIQFFGIGTGIDIGSNFRVWVEGHLP